MRVLCAGAVAIALVAGCGKVGPSSGDKASPEPDKTDKLPVMGIVDLQVLSQDYRANQAAGDEKYTGRRVTCEGIMHKLEKMESGDYRMRFEYFVDGFNMREGNVRAFFPAAEQPKLTKFEWRSTVHFTGRCDGLIKGEVLIRDCKIVDPPKK